VVPYLELLIKNGLAEKLEGGNCSLLKPRGARLPLPHLRELWRWELAIAGAVGMARAHKIEMP